MCTYSQASSAGSQRAERLMLCSFAVFALLFAVAGMTALFIPVESDADPLHVVPALAGGSSFIDDYNTLSTDNKLQPLRVLATVTAYSSTSDQTDSTPRITAANTSVREGIVAANFLPFGARIKFPELFGDKTFVVEDRLHPKNSHKIDIWFPTRRAAKEFGVRATLMEVSFPNDSEIYQDIERYNQSWSSTLARYTFAR